MEDKVAEEMRIVEEDKNLRDKEDFYAKMVENMTAYTENLRDFYNQVVIMRLDSVKAKLDYLKCVQELEYINSILENVVEDQNHT